MSEAVYHGVPDQCPIEDGDILNIDIAFYHDGFRGEVSETR